MADEEKLETTPSTDEETVTLTKDELDAMLARAREEAVAKVTGIPLDDGSMDQESIEDEPEPLDDVEVVEEQTKPPKKKNKVLRILGPIVAFFMVFVVAYLGYRIYMYTRTIMPKDHIYVCDNPDHKSDFENWVKDDLGVDWVPTYIVVKDGYVIGAFHGDIEKSYFDMVLGTTLSLDMPFAELPDYEITSLTGKTAPVNKIFGDGTYIIEYHWIDCPDCIHQDENYTDDIYEYYSTEMFYRYYVKSDLDKVKDKYR